MNKYKNKKCEFNGIQFDSEMEMNYYKFLLETYNEDDITIKPRYTLIEKFVDVNGKTIRPLVYEADYGIKGANGLIEKVIDVKGFETSDFKIKAKLFKYIYKMDLILVTVNPKKFGGGWTTLEELKIKRRDIKKSLL